MRVTLHLMTQDNQPYGSMRLCCEKCGLMMEEHAWTDSRDVYYYPPKPSTGPNCIEYVRCEDEKETA
jgi:hypothetical protein